MSRTSVLRGLLVILTAAAVGFAAVYAIESGGAPAAPALPDRAQRPPAAPTGAIARPNPAAPTGAIARPNPAAAKPPSKREIRAILATGVRPSCLPPGVPALKEWGRVRTCKQVRRAR